jgi:peroxiredoxin
VIEAGTRAPDFRLPDHEGKIVSLSELAGQRVLLAFYPADFSPVCTDQVSVYDERLAELESAGVALYGVSVDSAFCHAAFRRHLGVSIPLLADFHPKGEVARAYGVYSDKYGVSGRALVMIDPDGVVEWTHRSPSPLEVPSADLVFEALGKHAA